MNDAVHRCVVLKKNPTQRRSSLFSLCHRLTSATRNVTWSTNPHSHLHSVNVIWKSALPMYNISTTEIAAAFRLEHLLVSRLYLAWVFHIVGYFTAFDTGHGQMAPYVMWLCVWSSVAVRKVFWFFFSFGAGSHFSLSYLIWFWFSIQWMPSDAGYCSSQPTYILVPSESIAFDLQTRCNMKQLCTYMHM